MNFSEYIGKVCRFTLNSGKEYSGVPYYTEEDILKIRPLKTQLILGAEIMIKTTQISRVYSESLIVTAKNNS